MIIFSFLIPTVSLIKRERCDETLNESLAKKALLIAKRIINSVIISYFFSIHFSFADSPPIQLATKYRDDIIVQDYFISEKLDGIRAYWDGQQLISKQGNVFTAPLWFIEAFPKTVMDGELWIARQQFEKVSGIVRTRNHNNEAWQQVKFMIFDLPDTPTSFAKRVENMQQIIIDANTPYLAMIEQLTLPTTDALFDLLNKVVAENGEGLMLHHREALYQSKRSQDLMKLKKFEDEEATVLAYLPGKGKYQGLLGSLLVKNDEGITFKIGSGFSDKERENPPTIGSRITYRFTGKTSNNIPRFASFMRIREVF